LPLATLGVLLPGSGSLPAAAEAQKFTLMLALSRPSGAIAVEQRLDWRAPGGEAAQE
jgi:hypothetical protein